VRSEALALFPHCEEPDFVVSLGIGEPASSNYDVSMEDRRKHGMVSRAGHLIWEKLRDKAVRRASCMAKSASYRLDIEFDGDEPRLDDTTSITQLVSKVQSDTSLRPKIDAVARCMVASLFYFSLDSPPRMCNSNEYMLTGQIRCSLWRSESALKALLTKLASGRGRFMVNGSPIGDVVTDGSFLEKDGNFRICVSIKTLDRLAITLEAGGAEACNVSGSPFSVQKLVAAQGLDAPFGRPDHRKRKRSDDCASATVKKRRTIT
jgi:hypothetical protein